MVFPVHDALESRHRVEAYRAAEALRLVFHLGENPQVGREGARGFVVARPAGRGDLAFEGLGP